MNDPNATAFVPTGIKPATVFVADVDDRHVVGNSANVVVVRSDKFTGASGRDM